MSKRLIDLFSDSATKPSAEMRQAMAYAEVGDEQKLEDPTVTRLIEAVCELLNKPAGLFLPSGTMCNAVAIKTHTQPGDAVLVDRQSHILRAETGGTAMFSGAIIDQVESVNGIFTAEKLCQCFPKPSVYAPVPTLLCLEQTHNFGGGTIWPLDQLKDVCDTAHRNGLNTHLDGARLMNAVVASGIAADNWAKHFDSAWIDFSKALGAPFGAVLCGEDEFIKRARRFKHAFGGAMRQAGIMAAACLYALEHNVDRLAVDHANAQKLADLLANIKGITVLTPQPETNMVFLDVSQTGLTPPQFLERLQDKGVRMSAFDERVRAVTHLDISSADIEDAAAAVRAVLESTATPVRR